jgi:hypothetical protein
MLTPIEIIVIVATVLFLAANIYLSVRRKRKGIIGCASEYGCSAVSDMKRSLKEARESIINKQI